MIISLRCKRERLGARLYILRYCPAPGQHIHPGIQSTPEQHIVLSAQQVHKDAYESLAPVEPGYDRTKLRPTPDATTDLTTSVSSDDGTK